MVYTNINLDHCFSQWLDSLPKWLKDLCSLQSKLDPRKSRDKEWKGLGKFWVATGIHSILHNLVPGFQLFQKMRDDIISSISSMLCVCTPRNNWSAPFSQIYTETDFGFNRTKFCPPTSQQYWSHSNLLLSSGKVRIFTLKWHWNA